MIEDRAGKGVEALQQVVDRFQDEARKRPELAGVFSTFSARVPQLKFDLDRTKARRLDVPISDVFATLQANLGGYYVNDFDLYGKVWKVMVQAEGGVRTKPEDIAEPLRPEPQGRAGPAQLAGRGPLRPGADRRAPLQPLRRRQDQRRARPGLQLGPGARRDAGGRRRGPARGVRLRVDRHDLPGAEDRQPGDLHLRPLGRLRLPVHGGPLRELDPADGHHPDGPAGHVRRDRRALALRHAARRLRPDRPGHADRPGDQERDPDRRVRRRDASRSTG